MRAVFADTFFFLALLNVKDTAHESAVAIASQFEGKVVTTEWVLTEVADALAAPVQRHLFRQLSDMLSSDPDVLVVEADRDLFRSGCKLYFDRPDKGWSLTDCMSFVVMQRLGMTKALSGDRHFEQAGFVTLFSRA